MRGAASSPNTTIEARSRSARKHKRTIRKNTHATAVPSSAPTSAPNVAVSPPAHDPPPLPKQFWDANNVYNHESTPRSRYLKRIRGIKKRMKAEIDETMKEARAHDGTGSWG
jgi:hypothetical protein